MSRNSLAPGDLMSGDLMSPEHGAEIGLKLSRGSGPQDPTCRRLMAMLEDDNNTKDNRERSRSVKKK